MTHSIYDSDLPALIQPIKESNTRGNSLKLPKHRSETSIRRHVFRNRIVNDWNSLPEDVVNAPSLNCFKARLDRHWKNHPLKQRQNQMYGTKW